jgi:hypothetical protein
MAICLLLVLAMIYAEQIAERRGANAPAGVGASPAASAVDPGPAKAPEDLRGAASERASQR